MTDTTSGLGPIYAALSHVSAIEHEDHRQAETVARDVMRHIQEHREEMRSVLAHFENLAESGGLANTMMAMRLFLAIQIYKNRREPAVAEFDRAFAEVAHDLAPTYVLFGAEC